MTYLVLDLPVGRTDLSGGPKSRLSTSFRVREQSIRVVTLFGVVGIQYV